MTFRDENGIRFAAREIAVIAEKDGSWQATVPAPGASLGYYRVEAALSDGTQLSAAGTRPRGFLSYCVTPDPAARIDYGESGSRFGMQGGFSAVANVIPYLGIRWVLDGYNWRDLEPDYAGQFAEARREAIRKKEPYPAPHPVVEHVVYQHQAWKTYTLPTLMASAPLRAVDKNTLATLNHSQGALTTTPTLPNKPGGPPAISGEAAWSSYCAAAAQSYAANYPDRRQHIFQITWEPAIPWGYNGSPSQLVRIYQLAYQAMHASDPRSFVIGPCLFPDTTGDNMAEMQDLWRAGLASYLDGFSLHPYVTYPPEANGMVGQLRTQVWMARRAAGKALPLFGTEHGYQSKSNPRIDGELAQAQANIRQALITLGEGASLDIAFYVADWNAQDGSYGYYWNLDPTVPFGTDKIAPKPGAPAFAAMTYLLDGTQSAGSIPDLGGTAMGYRFVRGQTTILALWDYGCTRKVTVKTGLTDSGAESAVLYTWMGNQRRVRVVNGPVLLTLTSEPVYLRIEVRHRPAANH